MQLESHLAVGWLMGNLVPGGDRRLRALVMFSAMAPDLDGVSYLIGPDAYATAHHVYGHNLLAGAGFTLLCVLLAHPGWRIRILILSSLGFASHWAGDYFFSGWPLMTFWPWSRAEVMFRPRIGLDHPINRALSFVSLAFLVGSVWIWKRTIFETVWPALDRLLSGMVKPHVLVCRICGRATAQRCAHCEQPLCLRHAKITSRLLITCGPCDRRRDKQTT